VVEVKAAKLVVVKIEVDGKLASEQGPK